MKYFDSGHQQAASRLQRAVNSNSGTRHRLATMLICLLAASIAGATTPTGRAREIVVGRRMPHSRHFVAGFSAVRRSSIRGTGIPCLSPLAEPV